MRRRPRRRPAPRRSRTRVTETSRRRTPVQPRRGRRRVRLAGEVAVHVRIEIVERQSWRAERGSSNRPGHEAEAQEAEKKTPQRRRSRTSASGAAARKRPGCRRRETPRGRERGDGAGTTVASRRLSAGRSRSSAAGEPMIDGPKVVPSPTACELNSCHSRSSRRAGRVGGQAVREVVREQARSAAASGSESSNSPGTRRRGSRCVAHARRPSRNARAVFMRMPLASDEERTSAAGPAARHPRSDHLRAASAPIGFSV